MKLLYDTRLRRPACVLLQALARCEAYRLEKIFPVETWLDAPTPDMRVVNGTREEWEREAKMVKEGAVP